MENEHKRQPMKEWLFHTIFGTHTKAGKLFDVVLLFFIALSIVFLMLESVPKFDEKHHTLLVVGEWIITIFFTIEYILRIYVVRNKWKYIFSFYGIIDLLSILPAYFGIFIPEGKSLAAVRALRLFRIFRIFKLTQFIRGRNIIAASLKASWPKIIVFLSFVVLMVIVIGTIMYMIESDHPESGFTSIPQSVYWAIVTMTTVGYGDISPLTPLGKFIASLVMIIGYAIIAVPTGIVSVEMAKTIDDEDEVSERICENCQLDKHNDDAKFCRRCGTELNQ